MCLCHEHGRGVRLSIERKSMSCNRVTELVR